MLLNRTIQNNRFISETNNEKADKTISNSKQNQIATNLSDYQLKLFNYKQNLVKDINHPRIRELIYSCDNIDKLLHGSTRKSQIKQNFKNNITNLQLLEQRKWLTKKGKKYLIDFDDNERRQMKICFNAMDTNRNGSIGIDQLEDLLISVGLLQTRQQVKQLIDSVDQDKSGKIQFSQFLKMIQNDEGQNQEIVQFFKYIINENRKKNDQQIQWHKDKSLSKQRSISNEKSCTIFKKKVSLIHDKQNIFSSNVQKSSFHQNRNKVYSSPERYAQIQKPSKNSALNIFEKHPHPKNLPFGMVVSHIRRKHMMTALKIGHFQVSSIKKGDSISSSVANKSSNNVSCSNLKSSKNMKELKSSLNEQKSYTDDQVVKGKNVMQALKKMWDRRLLRQIKQKKSRQASMKMSILTEKKTKKGLNFPNIR